LSYAPASIALMNDIIKEAVATICGAVSRLDSKELSPDDAAELVEAFSKGERACQAGRAVAMQRALRAGSWRKAGYRTPAQWLAARSKKTLSSAITTVNTAWRMERFPTTREQFVSGQLSEIQTAQIIDAATADPGAEQGLLDLAARETVTALKQRCREVRAAAEADEDLAERIRRERYLRHWSDPDGAVRLDGRLPPDDGAKIVAVIEARTAAFQEAARRSGQREPADAYAADALLSLAQGKAGPKSVVLVHVDQPAWDRGRTVSGETCAIEGIGPVPVATARRLAAEGIVKVVASQDNDVTAVAHLGRTIPAKLRTALEARDPMCVVPGCDLRTGLEIDHIIPLSEGGVTALSNLARLCRHHHGEKTHRGWRLGGKPGAWSWTRPGRNGQQKERPPPIPSG
jgi:uncharacterized protein DUF222/HNH endonuclease